MRNIPRLPSFTRIGGFGYILATVLAVTLSLTPVLCGATPVATLNNPSPAADEAFSASVAISGTLLVVGSHADDSGALDAGSAYVYDLSSGTPTVPVFTLNNPSPAAQDRFGISVAISGTVLVVGAAVDDAGATDAGSAYVYDLSSASPTAPVFTLNNPSPAANDLFGNSVAISGTRVVVGAFADDAGATNAGSAYVYDLSSGTPTVPVAVLSNPSPAAEDYFGWRVAISGTRVVVGAFGDDAGAGNAGSAYVYDLSSGTPTVPVAVLSNPSPAERDEFGSSVAISGTRVVIGAHTDDTGALDAGSAYVYDLSSGTPTVPVATLNNPSPAFGESFGDSVVISGTRVLVGAPSDATGGTTAAGSVYVYDLNSGTPTVPAATLNNPSPETRDYFGGSVAISGTRVLVGTSGDDTGATDAGSAYLYDLRGSAENIIPVATGDVIELPMEHFNVKSNDTDGDFDILTVTGVGSAAHGTVTLNGDNTVSYTPNATFAGTDTFTYTISDGFGGTAIGTVTVSDTTAPVVTRPNVTAEATSAAGAIVSYSAATASDAVGVTSVTYSQNSGTVFPIGETTVTITAKDAANNTGTGTFTVTVQDTTAPVVVAHANVGPVEATSDAGAAAAYDAASATDAVGVVSLAYSKNSGTVFPIGVTTVTITAKDAANNTGTGTFTVTVSDTTAPMVNHPDVTAEATNAAGATVSYGAATASDAVGVTSVTYSQNSGTVFPIGITTVTMTAKDAANNTGTGTFTVTVSDTTAPVVEAHANVIALATSDTGATVTYDAASATDAVTVNPAITYSQNTGTFFPIGVTTVTITAKDAANNTGTGTFTVTVLDATEPTIGGEFSPLVLSIIQGGNVALPDYRADAVTSDNVGVTSVTQSPVAGTMVGEGSTTVTLTAHDAEGNTADLSFEVMAVVGGTTALAAKRGDVPGAGVDLRIPAGSKWGAFGVPSITKGGMNAGWLGTALTPENKTFRGIFAGAILAPTLRVRTGYAATDTDGNAMEGVTFKSFRDPVFAGVEFAVAATVAGARVGAGNDTGIWVGDLSTVTQIAREGALAPGASGAKFKAFTSVVMPALGTVFFTAKLAAPASKDMGLWVWTASAGTQLALREGGFVNTVAGPLALKTFAALTSVNGSFGHGRYDADEGALDVRLSFADPDKTTAIGTVGADGSVQILLRSAQTDSDGRVPVSFGVPSSPGRGLRATAVTTFAPDSSRGIGPKSTVTIYDYEEGNIRAQQGMLAPGAAPATFKTFHDPVSGYRFDGGRVQCFSATLAGTTASSNSALWAFSDSLELVARKGAEPPGAAGTKWKSFTSLSVLDGRGPMFTAKLASGTAKVTAANDTGLWATDSTGVLRLIIREGDTLPGGTLKSFNVLGAVSGSPGQRRGWTSGDRSARVVYLAFFADGGSAILSTAVP